MTDPHWPRADVWLGGETESPELLVVGVPTSAASLAKSRADLTPLAMRERLVRYSSYHGELDIDLSSVGVADLGNWPVSELDMHAMPGMVGGLATGLPEAPLRLFLGGDNAITRPLVGAVANDLSDVGLITFDAHHDVRSLDAGPTSGTPIRGLIEEDGLPGKNVAQIGIHSFANSVVYRRYCEEAGVHLFSVAEVEERGIESVVSTALERLEHCRTVYVDVDLDVLDAAFAPACPGARPGGMSVRDLAEGVAHCARSPKVSSFDFVEVDTERDEGSRTLDVMAHLFLTAVAGYAAR